MLRFELKIDDNILTEVEKSASNKSEFIRQAIVEKLNSNANKNLEKSRTHLAKISELKEKIIDLEKMIFLLNQKSEKQTALMFKLLEEIFKINIMSFELHTQTKKEKYKENLQQYVDAKIELLKSELVNI